MIQLLQFLGLANDREDGVFPSPAELVPKEVAAIERFCEVADAKVAESIYLASVTCGVVCHVTCVTCGVA
jgi:hypothetical protein